MGHDHTLKGDLLNRCRTICRWTVFIIVIAGGAVGVDYWSRARTAFKAPADFYRAAGMTGNFLFPALNPGRNPLDAAPTAELRFSPGIGEYDKMLPAGMVFPGRRGIKGSRKNNFIFYPPMHPVWRR